MAMEASAERTLAEDDGEVERGALALPREMMLFAVAMPPVLYLLLDPGAFQNDTARALRSLASITLYTFVCTLATHAAFLVVPARICARPRVVRMATYLSVLVLFVIAGTALMSPVLALFCPMFVGNALRLTVKGIVISVLYASVGVATVYVRARLGRMRERARAAREAALEARLRALTARTNPHFLFNSLNAGMSLIATDPERAETHFARLSSLFRYALDGSSRRHVRLDEELDNVRDYLEIESARFGERLRYELHVDEELNGAQVPPMLVQPLVENAVVHGVTARREGGKVCVTARRDEEHFVIRVEDDGVGEGRSRHRGSGTALADLRERLDIVYGAKATLTTGSAGASGGFVAELRLPRASS